MLTCIILVRRISRSGRHVSLPLQPHSLASTPQLTRLNSLLPTLQSLFWTSQKGRSSQKKRTGDSGEPRVKILQWLLGACTLLPRGGASWRSHQSAEAKSGDVSERNCSGNGEVETLGGKSRRQSVKSPRVDRCSIPLPRTRLCLQFGGLLVWWLHL